MKIQNKNAFTIPELIVVILILSVLGTIAFINLEGYIERTRDATRGTDLRNISMALDTQYTKGQNLYIPSEKIDITASGETILYQGFIKDDILNKIGVFNGGKDPLDGSFYTYTINKKKDKYQLMGFMELSFKETFFEAVEAADLSERHPIILGDRLGIFLDPLTKNPIQSKGANIEVINTDINYLIYVNNDKELGNAYGTGTTMNEMIGHVVNPQGSCLNILMSGRSKGNGYYKIDKDGTGKTYEKVICNMHALSGGLHANCKDINESGNSVGNGIYTISGSGGVLQDVYCNMTQEFGGWTRVLHENYETPVSGWSQTNAITTCGSFGKILGGYDKISNLSNTKEVDLLGIDHTEVWVKLDYIKIDSWDSERAKVDVNGDNKFNEVISGGEQVCGRTNFGWNEKKVPIETLVSDGGSDTMILKIYSTLGSGPTDESYGYDNLEVYVR